MKISKHIHIYLYQGQEKIIHETRFCFKVYSNFARLFTDWKNKSYSTKIVFYLGFYFKVCLCLREELLICNYIYFLRFNIRDRLLKNNVTCHLWLNIETGFRLHGIYIMYYLLFFDKVFFFQHATSASSSKMCRRVNIISISKKK